MAARAGAGNMAAAAAPPYPARPGPARPCPAHPSPRPAYPRRLHAPRAWFPSQCPTPAAGGRRRWEPQRPWAGSRCAARRCPGPPALPPLPVAPSGGGGGGLQARDHPAPGRHRTGASRSGSRRRSALGSASEPGLLAPWHPLCPHQPRKRPLGGGWGGAAWTTVHVQGMGVGYTWA